MTVAPQTEPNAGQPSIVFLYFGGKGRRTDAVKAILADAFPHAQFVTGDSIDELKRILASVSPTLCLADSAAPRPIVETLIRAFAADNGHTEVLLLLDPALDEAGAPLPSGSTDFIAFSDDPPGREDFVRRVGCALERRANRISDQARREEAFRKGTIRDIHGALSRINHELNNPLAIISGNAQLFLELAEAEGLTSDLVDPVEDIEEAAQRLAGIIHKLVDLRDTLIPSEAIKAPKPGTGV